MSSNDLRYPLAWPDGWPRSPRQIYSRFGETTVAKQTRLLEQEVERAGGLDLIISTNIALRLDGLPRSGQRQPDDPGVAIYFVLEGANVAFACDTYVSVQENVRALVKYIENLRALDRHGVGVRNQAFRGFQALPPVGGTSRSWHQILEISPDASLVQAKASYRRLAKVCHPDQGGSQEAFVELKGAWEKAQEVLS